MTLREFTRIPVSTFGQWSSSHGRDASFHKIWYIYLYPIRSYLHFPENKDSGRRHLGFVGESHGTAREGVFVHGAYSL